MDNSISKLLKYVAISLLFSLCGFVFGKLFIPARIASLGSLFLGIFFIITLIASLFLKKGRNFSLTMNKVYIFTFFHGICIYPVINYYTYSLGISTVLGVLIGTISVFACLSIYASKNNTNKVLHFGPVLSCVLIGLLIMNIINIFIVSNTINIISSSIGVVLFTVYIVHSITTFKYASNYINLSNADDFAPFVLNLYTDFINLFMHILRLLNSINRD